MDISKRLWQLCHIYPGLKVENHVYINYWIKIHYIEFKILKKKPWKPDIWSHHAKIIVYLLPHFSVRLVLRCRHTSKSQRVPFTNLWFAQLTFSACFPHPSSTKPTLKTTTITHPYVPMSKKYMNKFTNFWTMFIFTPLLGPWNPIPHIISPWFQRAPVWLSSQGCGSLWPSTAWRAARLS